MASKTPPRHVACIMDGNGRWAKHRGLDRMHGHLAARSAINSAVDSALSEGVEWLTLFAFSTENWSRPEEEVHFLVNFLPQQMIGREVSRLHQRGVRIRILSRADSRIPAPTMAALRDAEKLTCDNSALHLTLAFDYGGRQDIVDASRALTTQQTPDNEITAETFARHLCRPELPDVDLLIRTGGEHRLSNFLLWHCAYAELIFLDVLWPDFRSGHFRHTLDLYQQRQRRFGGLIPEQPGPVDADVPSDIPLPIPPGHLTHTTPGLYGLPSLSDLLSLPGDFAAHVGLSLLDRLKTAGERRPDRWS
ncbi:polyprenyl diphosphate synthase [Streptomyces pinistramenti]|uniref:polyprenyl diphosphate synthase n=1 Tax=Streptomyces pinistramenti TaxID=2884812 RepID=UPI001D07D9FC|nr:polyprenyl diphosphate synthase [Streptomyces pinistramenti]MCB5912176.1 di-trans,poly-cis-decaprenylcistransferase [Streptomyces pinistramenti]